MEPDLDRLVDFVSGGRMFPQFSNSWATYFARAANLRLRISESGESRLRIAIVSKSEESFTALFLALCRSKVDLFFYNPNWGKQETAEANAIANPHWVIGDFVGSDFRFIEHKGVKSESVKFEGLRVMIPTGGSSGKIRFAIHDWSTLSASAYGFQSYFGCNSTKSLCVLPLYHVSGFLQLIRTILCLGQIVFSRIEGFKEGHHMLFQSSDKDCFLSVVPAQLERLLKDESNFELLRKYEAIFVGGGPCSVGLMEDCREAKLPLAPTYGMTETAAQVVTLKPSEFVSGEFSVGRCLPHVSLTFVEDELAEAHEKKDCGRIQISGASVFRGYYGDSESQDRHVILTSDLGYLNERGCLKILGRRDRVIISGGENISLREVEIAFEEGALVRDVAAFGIEDREWGTKLALAYVPKESFITEETVKESIKGKLANFKEPKVFLKMDELPRNEAGKLLVGNLLQVAKSVR